LGEWDTNSLIDRLILIDCDACAVTGCADPELPRLTWMSRRQDTLTVFCNQTSERWHLVCKGNTWVGTYGNCTRGSSVSRKSK